MAQELKLTRSTDEVRPSGVFAARNIFEIPYFQRPYKWDAEKIRQLQQDLLKVVDGETDVHFLGAIITHSRPKPNATASQRIEVVDGQQRLTTIYLFICAAVRSLIEFGALEDAYDNYLNFIIDPFHKPPGSNLRLQPSADDRAHLNAIVEEIVQSKGFADKVAGMPFRKLSVSAGLPSTAGKRIKNNYDNARRFFKSHYDQGGLDRVKDIITALLDRLTVVQIEVQDPTNGPKIFDSLNSKQQPMTTGDLIRNDIFSRAAEFHPAMVEALDTDHWQPYYQGFIHGDRNLFDDYFFPFGLIKNPQLTKSAVYKSLVDTWAHEPPEKVIEDLRTYQPDFMDLKVGTNRAKHDKELAKAIRRLFEAGAPSSVLPFAMQMSHAAGNTVPEVEAIAIFDTIDAFLTRRAIAGYEPTGLHAVFKGLWRDLKDEVRRERVLEEIRKHTTVPRPNDDEVIEKVKTRDLYRAGITRYVVREYDRSLGGDDHATVHELEHVLPRTPKPGTWTAFSPEEHQAQHNRLANLLPLSAKMNQSISNAEYSAKRPRYMADSVFKSVRVFGEEHAEWTPADLAARGEILAAWVVSRWPQV